MAGILLYALENKGITLPESYKEFLCTHDGRQNYKGKKIKKFWRLFTIKNEKWGKSLESDFYGMPTHKSINYFLSHYQEFTKKDYTLASPGNKRISIGRLNQCITIGEENGDFLYLDPKDDFSLWCYWHDGSDVQRLANSFGEWLATAKKEHPERLESAPKMLDKTESFCGNWKAVNPLYRNLY